MLNLYRFPFRDVLRQILLMRKLASRDARKRRKLEKLERGVRLDSDEEDSLREFLRQSEAVFRGPAAVS